MNCDFGSSDPLNCVIQCPHTGDSGPSDSLNYHDAAFFAPEGPLQGKPIYPIQALRNAAIQGLTLPAFPILALAVT